MKHKLLILASTLLMLAIPANASDTVLQSRSWSSGSRQTQQFSDYLAIKPGQEKQKLTLTFQNGRGGIPGFSYFKVYLANKQILTEENFREKPTVILDLTNKITSGNTIIGFVGMGVPGSTFTFVVTTPVMVKLTSANPKKVAPEDKISIYGSGFSTKPSENQVDFGGIQVQPDSSSSSSLELIVPKNAKAGDNKIKVSLHGSVSNEITVKVQPKPEVSGVSLFSGPPGSPVTVTGKNFSAVPSENTVYFGGATASVSAATPNSLTTTIPMSLDAEQPTWGIVVNVETNGVKSDSNVTVNVQNRYINEGEESPQGPRN